MRKRVLKHVAIVVASAALGLVGGFILAILTSPFWGWFEAKTGIESLGHSGPADWVFEVPGGFCTILLFCGLEYMSRTRSG